jgi:hypothetical protein
MEAGFRRISRNRTATNAITMKTYGISQTTTPCLKNTPVPVDTFSDTADDS